MGLCKDAVLGEFKDIVAEKVRSAVNASVVAPLPSHPVAAPPPAEMDGAPHAARTRVHVASEDAIAVSDGCSGERPFERLAEGVLDALREEALSPFAAEDPLLSAVPDYPWLSAERREVINAIPWSSEPVPPVPSPHAAELSRPPPRGTFTVWVPSGSKCSWLLFDDAKERSKRLKEIKVEFQLPPAVVPLDQLWHCPQFLPQRFGFAALRGEALDVVFREWNRLGSSSPPDADLDEWPVDTEHRFLASRLLALQDALRVGLRRAPLLVSAVWRFTDVCPSACNISTSNATTSASKLTFPITKSPHGPASCLPVRVSASSQLHSASLAS